MNLVCLCFDLRRNVLHLHQHSRFYHRSENRSWFRSCWFQDEEKIEKLMTELAKEKQKRKKLRHWIGISLLFYFIVLLIYPILLNFLWLFASWNGCFHAISAQFITNSRLIRFSKFYVVLISKVIPPFNFWIGDCVCSFPFSLLITIAIFFAQVAIVLSWLFIRTSAELVRLLEFGWL